MLHTCSTWQSGSGDRVILSAGPKFYIKATLHCPSSHGSGIFLVWLFFFSHKKLFWPSLNSWQVSFSSCLAPSELGPHEKCTMHPGAPLPACLEVQANPPVLLTCGLVLFHLLKITALWWEPYSNFSHLMLSHNIFLPAPSKHAPRTNQLPQLTGNWGAARLAAAESYGNKAPAVLATGICDPSARAHTATHAVYKCSGASDPG